MTVTFKARREMARILREDAYSWLEQNPSADADRDARAILGDVSLALGFGLDQSKVSAVDLLDNLADSLDCPGCRDETPDGPEFTCSLCGCRLRRMAGRHGSTLHYVGMGFRTPPHCPGCGAVVE